MIRDHGKNIFSRDDIAKLAPLMAKEDSLFATVKLFVKSVVTQDDILHRLFPELLIGTFASSQNAALIDKLVRWISLSGSGSDGIDGRYYGRLSDNLPNALDFRCNNDDVNVLIWGGEVLNKFQIIVRDDIWVILGRDEEQGEHILWKRPHSRTLMLPPRDGWVAVDELARGKNPTLKYRMREK
jgi:hypothetical protein